MQGERGREEDDEEEEEEEEEREDATQSIPTYCTHLSMLSKFHRSTCLILSWRERVGMR